MKKAELIKYLGCKSDENRFLNEVLNGFEPMIRELQSHALPLGYSTTFRYFAEQNRAALRSRIAPLLEHRFYNKNHAQLPE